jgi:hypothetical protein
LGVGRSGSNAIAYSSVLFLAGYGVLSVRSPSISNRAHTSVHGPVRVRPNCSGAA